MSDTPNTVPSNRFFVSIDELAEHFESQRIYHQRNANRWKDARQHGGMVSGISGRQSAATIHAEVLAHQRAEMAYDDALKALKQLMPARKVIENFGDRRGSELIEQWGGAVETYLNLDGVPFGTVFVQNYKQDDPGVIQQLVSAAEAGLTLTVRDVDFTRYDS